MNSLKGVGIQQLARPVSLSQNRSNGNVKLPNVEITRGGTTSTSGRSSKTKSAVVGPITSAQGKRRVLTSTRASSSNENDVSLRTADFGLSVDGLLPRGKKSLSTISSSHDDQGMAFSHGDSPSESTPTSMAQSIVQGFAESAFVTELTKDIAGTVGAVGGVSEFDSMAVAVPMYQPRIVWFAKSAEQESMFIDRAINAVIVGSATTLALTKILTVDHDYWHGWTLMEIVQYAPKHNWFAYEELLKTHPVIAKMMISGTVYSLGDWVAQCYEGKSPIDFNRMRMFRSGLVGFCLHGSLSHFYYQFCEWLFPFQGWWVLPLKIGFDQTIWSGIWNSIYFITVGLLRMESPGRIVKELRETFFPLLTAGWKLWPFAHVITYGVIPVEQRLLWVDMVEIVWVTLLSMYSNEKAEARIAESESPEALTDNATESRIAAGAVDGGQGEQS